MLAWLGLNLWASVFFPTMLLLLQLLTWNWHPQAGLGQDTFRAWSDLPVKVWSSSSKWFFDNFEFLQSSIRGWKIKLNEMWKTGGARTQLFFAPQWPIKKLPQAAASEELWSRTPIKTTFAEISKLLPSFFFSKAKSSSAKSGPRYF